MNHQFLKDVRILLQKEKIKEKMAIRISHECQKEDFKTNPGDAWQMVFKLIEGFQGHHWSFCQKKFKNKKGKMSKNDNENAKILKQHYKEVFNWSVPVDLSVIKGIKQLPFNEVYGIAPSKEEIKIAISDMKKQQSSQPHWPHNRHDKKSSPLKD